MELTTAFPGGQPPFPDAPGAAEMFDIKYYGI
jgi:hypothetical protein